MTQTIYELLNHPKHRDYSACTNNVEWLAVSNSLVKSMNTAPVTILLSIFQVRILSVNYVVAVTVYALSQGPNCLSESRWLSHREAYS